MLMPRTSLNLDQRGTEVIQRAATLAIQKLASKRQTGSISSTPEALDFETGKLLSRELDSVQLGQVRVCSTHV